MITSAPTLARLRRPLITGAIATLACGALLSWSQAEHDSAAAMLRQHTTRLTQARAMLQTAREADAAARNVIRQIETLRDAGLLDAPDRQAWQQHLLGLHSKLGLSKLQWELGPLKPVNPEGNGKPAHPPTALRLATLHLKGELAHEGRLLTLLERPGTASRGLFLPRRCRLARSQPAPDAKEISALTADCEIDWVFLHLPEAP